MDERLVKIKQLITKGQLTRALSLAGTIEDLYWKSYALRWIAEAFAEIEDERALEIACRIPIESLKNETLWVISYIFSKNEKFRLSLKAAREIKDSYLRKKAMRTVSNNLAKAIIQKGVSEIKLSDLELDEKDVEELKPLPFGIVYKDKKLLVGSSIHPIKGEIKYGVISLNGEEYKLKKSKSAILVSKNSSSMEEDIKIREYLVSYILKLIDNGNLKEAYSIAIGLDEPERSKLLEEIGVLYLKRGELLKAEEIFNKLIFADYLGMLLFRRYLITGKYEKVGWILSRIKNPGLLLSALYELAKNNMLDEKIVTSIFKELSWYKIGRILKFLAFELLNEAKKQHDKRLIRISKKVFQMGKKFHKNAM